MTSQKKCRFKIDREDVVEVTRHALIRFWLRIDPIPSRDEVEKRIKDELRRGFFLTRWKLAENGQVILCAHCSGMKLVLAPEERCWTILTLMEGKRRGSSARRFERRY